MTPDAREEHGLEHEVLRYLLHHPELIDNLEGFVRWRLPSARLELTVEEIRSALDWLIMHGFVLPISTSAGILFRLNPDRVQQAELLVNENRRHEVPISTHSIAEDKVQIRIKNQAKHLLLVPLSSRATLHLSPGETSAAVDEAEISNNSQVTKMLKGRLISVVRTTSGSAPPSHESARNSTVPKEEAKLTGSTGEAEAHVSSEQSTTASHQPENASEKESPTTAEVHE